MPRFDIKALLYSTALISLGLGLAYFLFASKLTQHWPSLYVGLLSLGIGPLIGAGFLRPFGKAWIGCALGVMGEALRLVVVCYILNYRRLDSWIIAALLGILATIMLIFALRHYANRKRLTGNTL